MFGRHHQDPGDAGSDEVLVHDATRARQDPALAVGLALGAVLVIALVVGIVQNDDDVRLEWANVDLDAPLWALLVGAAVLGALLWVVGRWVVVRMLQRTGERRAAAEELADRHRDRPVRTFP